MKHKLLFILFLQISLTISAQPQGINYQGVARDAGGQALLNQNIALRLSILDSSANGTPVYVETQNTTTNNSGLFNLSIGTGTIVSGVFVNIPWGQGDKWLKIEMDAAGGSNYQLIGTSQFMSVPYSFFANSANTANSSSFSDSSANGMPSGASNGEMLYWNGTSWVKVTVGSHGQYLAFCNGVPTWGGCLPVLTTTAIGSISYTTASSGGNVSHDGGTSVTTRGVCWNTSPNPTTANSKTTDGSGTGTYTSSITGLTPNTTYFLRAYATNSVGTSYGSELNFTTLALTMPTVTTAAISSISYITVSCGGNVSNDGGATVTERGVCWSTSVNPTTANSKTTDGSGTGVYSSIMTSLGPNTTYYVRAYATNSAGTSYGSELNFTTLALTIPSLTTTAASAITIVSASSGGNISTDGGATVTAKGVCWSTTQNPTTANSKTTDGSGTGTYTSSITGLTANTLYYIRAYASNSVGTSYGNEINFTSSNLPAIGSSYLGGILAYILQPGDPGYDANSPHGLIAAPSNQSTGAQWGCYTTGLSGADGTSIGSGNQNTIDIMAGCSTAGIAARICGDLVLNGYSDWYLPSKDELNKLYLNQVAIGGFATDYYWSSSETSGNHAWGLGFNFGYQSYGDFAKSGTHDVRAVRAF